MQATAQRRVASENHREKSMNWIADRLRRKTDPKESNAQPMQGEYDSEAGRLWHRLLEGFERDLHEYRQSGDAGFQRVSEFECRISNPAAHTAAIVAADMPAQTIRYDYEPLGKDTAVPERGILTIRKSSLSFELYSADQRLSLEEARQLILEPLLFPKLPGDLGATDT
jgi:hypothetical protein